MSKIKSSKKQLPGILNMNRTVVITDAIMKNLLPGGETSLVSVVRHGIRGVQNLNKKDSDVANIQDTETAKLDANAIALRVEFGIRFIDLATSLKVCAPTGKQTVDETDVVKNSIKQFVIRSKESFGIQEIALRYARNIANGRWLWRNRTIAKSIEVRVTFNRETIIFNATDIAINHFDEYSEHEKRLAKHIADCFIGDAMAEIFVVADVDFGVTGAIEVFPSQAYLSETTRGFSRSLFKYGAPTKVKDNTNSNVVGYAAIRDQKIGNALRTFDTWYADYVTTGVPIPIEPNGASLDASRFFRKNTTDSAFSLFLNLDEIDTESDQGLFCIGCMIRGGVYNGEKDDTSVNGTEKELGVK